MSINRRNFLRALGLTGVVLGTGKKLNASEPGKSNKEFNAVLYDATRCIGCQSCEIACAMEYGLSEPDPDDYRHD